MDSVIYAVGYSKSSDFGFASNGEADAIIMSISLNTGDLNWIKNFGGSKSDVFKSIIQLSDGNFLCMGYSASTDYIFNIKGSTDVTFVKFDKNFNILLSYSLGGSSGEQGRKMIKTSTDEIIAVAYTNSTDMGFVNKGSIDALLIKLKITDPDIPQSQESLNQINLIPDNILELSINTSSVIFENFSVLDTVEKLNAVEIKISSSLNYNLSVSLETDIIGKSDGNTLDPSTINLKLNDDINYKSFSNTDKILNIAQNQAKCSNKIYSLDMKIKENKITAFDIYETVLRFEVVQL